MGVSSREKVIFLGLRGGSTTEVEWCYICLPGASQPGYSCFRRGLMADACERGLAIVLVERASNGLVDDGVSVMCQEATNGNLGPWNGGDDWWGFLCGFSLLSLLICTLSFGSVFCCSVVVSLFDFFFLF